MSTYEIFPSTNVEGDTVSLDTTDVSLTTCRRFCDDTFDCNAFTWDLSNEKCTLYSNLAGFKNINGIDAYVKKGAPSYWMFWVLIVGIMIVLFLNKCRK